MVQVRQPNPTPRLTEGTVKNYISSIYSKPEPRPATGHGLLKDLLAGNPTTEE